MDADRTVATAIVGVSGRCLLAIGIGRADGQATLIAIVAGTGSEGDRPTCGRGRRTGLGFVGIVGGTGGIMPTCPGRGLNGWRGATAAAAIEAAVCRSNPVNGRDQIAIGIIAIICSRERRCASIAAVAALVGFDGGWPASAHAVGRTFVVAG